MFRIIQDVANPEYHVIYHNPTGFYNASKTLAQLQTLYNKRENTGIGGWVRLKRTKLLISDIKNEFQVDNVIFTLNAETPNEYKGTYMHECLYRDFLCWLDTKYAISIFRIISKSQKEFESRLNQELNEKDSEISKLKAKIDEMLSIGKHIVKQNDNLESEVKAARQDISHLEEVVIEQHQTTLEIAQHTSPIVKPSKMQYFAMTAYSQVGDDSGKIYFRNWRLQAQRITKELVAAMTTPKDVKGGISYTVHRLIVPPIYVPGPVGVGNAGSDKLRIYIKCILDRLNQSRPKNDKIKIKSFFDQLGIKAQALNPVWSPNEYVSHCQFIDFFLDEIKETKSQSFNLSNEQPEIQKSIDECMKKQHQSFINAIGTSRESIERIIEMINHSSNQLDTANSKDETDSFDEFTLSDYTDDESQE